MPKEYTKIDSQRFTSEETKQEVITYDVAILKEERSTLVEHMADCQARVGAIDALLAEGAKLGVEEVEVAEAEVIE